MKHRLPALFALLACAAVAMADDARIATVNLAQLIRNHPSTEKNKAELNEMKADFERQRDEKLKGLVELRKEAEEAMERAQSDALSAAALTAARETARSKMATVKKREGELRDFVDDLQQQLTEAERERLNDALDDIHAHLNEYVKEQGISLVIDSSRSAVGGFSSVLYAAESLDITKALEERIAAATTKADADSKPTPATKPAE